MESSLSASRFNILRHTYTLSCLPGRRQGRQQGLRRTYTRRYADLPIDSDRRQSPLGCLAPPEHSRMNVPSVDVFNSHGLYDIVVDSTGSKSVGQSVSGWANLRPNATHPLLEPSSGTVVKFYWCSNTDRDAARQFRRRCQGYAIATLPTGPADKGKQTDNGRRVLAWWETDGLWMITNESEEEVVALGTWWTDRLAEQQEGESNGHGTSETAGVKAASSEVIYADACEVFAGMSEAIRVRNRHLPD